jgi:limonene 1,2-monooxygenase
MHMRFGAFLAPFHPAGQNPTLALRRDLDLITALDELGFDEVWAGEHHSGGWELIGSPELFLAAAGERTSRIMLGTGVVSLPYHHPFHVADRIVLLDHLTRGRAMLGVGPGALPGDAHFLGLEPTRQRDMMDEALGVIKKLLTDDEPVTYKSDWFELVEAQLQLKPFQRPTMPLAVAATMSPAGMVTAGKHGTGVLCVATYTAEGAGALPRQWAFAEQAAGEAGQPAPRREDWRLVVPYYLAESKQEAIEAVEEGVKHWYNEYLIHTLGAPGREKVPSGRVLIDGMNMVGGAIIGTPDEAIATIKRLQEVTGGFGCLLNLANDWTTPENTLRSYQLMARYVVPEFQDSLTWPKRTHEWTLRNKEQLMAGTQAAIAKAMEQHKLTSGYGA